MKGIKRRIACVLMAVVMAFGVAGAAFAAGAGSITIVNAVEDQTYSVYKVLDLNYNAATKSHSYTAASGWADFISSAAVDGTYVDVDDQGYVTWHMTCTNMESSHVHVDACYADAAAFAKLALAYAKSNSIASVAADTAEGNGALTFAGLDLGYYLVDSSLGVLCSLDSTNPNAEMREKNSIPDITKEVQENPAGTWGATNDASIGDAVNFRSTITAYPGAQGYVMHDKMSQGLTLDASTIAVAGLTKGTHYKVYTTDLCSDCDFHIVFEQSYLDTITAQTSLLVTYSAVLNSDAVVAGVGNPNDARLEYGDENSTEWRHTVTYTWSMGILKYGDGDEDKVLEGATFVFLNADGTKVAKVANGEMVGWVDVPAAVGGVITWPEGTELVTDKNGEIAIAGLDAGKYRVREVAAPAGYNKLNVDQEVVINAGSFGNDGAVLEYAPVVAKVNNQSGPELPSTGGMGTTIVYAIGAMLIVCSAVLLVVRRHAADNDK